MFSNRLSLTAVAAFKIYQHLSADKKARQLTHLHFRANIPEIMVNVDRVDLWEILIRPTRHAAINICHDNIHNILVLTNQHCCMYC